MSKPKIKAPKSISNTSKSQIPTKKAHQEIARMNEGRVKYSFLFFDRTHEAFNCGDMPDNWFIDFFDIMKHLSEMSLQEFRLNRSRRLRVHKHDFSRIAFPFQLPDAWMEQLSEEDFIQCSVSQARGRVHGFLLHGTFFIIWLDPHHNLYPMERHGGLKLHDALPSSYELLEQELRELQERYSKLEKEYEEILEEKTAPES